MALLPRTATASEHQEAPTMDMDEADEMMDVDTDAATTTPQHQILLASQNGSLALVTPVPEEPYRRLSALQSQLSNSVEHACGLNPRAFRAVESDGSAGRGMLDGALLRLWLELGAQRQMEIAGRVGAEGWQIRADLGKIVGGGGLGFL
jgi:cleavage and polyadenylation specificity factor subunit 1